MDQEEHDRKRNVGGQPERIARAEQPPQRRILPQQRSEDVAERTVGAARGGIRRKEWAGVLCGKVGGGNVPCPSPRPLGQKKSRRRADLGGRVGGADCGGRKERSEPLTALGSVQYILP
eukprot:scaffold4434_cov109-Isochrysis_galbana.AAC.11